MRLVSTLSLALTLCAPVAALAAAPDATDNFVALDNMLGTYQHVQSVRVVEQFPNGSVATVDVTPPDQYRVAQSGHEDPQLVLQLAKQPIGYAARGAQSGYSVTPLGKKTIEGVKADGYRIVDPQGTYDETIWIDGKHLPISAQVQTQGQTVSVLFGNYVYSAPLIATH